MSLLPAAYEKRMWGDFPTLRSILKDAKVADHHYGPSTASDNIFDRVQRLLEVALIVQDNKEATIAALNRDDPRDPLAKDLFALKRAMNWAESYVGAVAGEIEELLRRS